MFLNEPVINDPVVNDTLLQKLNVFDDLAAYAEEVKIAIENLNSRIDTYMYWINPINWVKEGWGWIDTNIGNGALDEPFLVASMVLIWLIIFGAKWPKKWLWWGWIGFWILRGFVFI